jgi:mannose-6-phosphate isomerase
MTHPHMATLYPLKFQPIFKERVWGARNLERLYRKALPPGVPIGESWEITDRPGDASVIANGSLAGRDLRWLMENHASELLGNAASLNGRFPLLIKILDAQDTLSLQVHPPAAKAAELKGEPKTEMWFITEAQPDAALFVGLRRGVTRAEFERRISDGTVAECFYRHAVKAGDAMFLPSGRVHAIGAGNVIFEIQQNSDTTYRVFDWNRVGLDGKPRELHVPQSLASIDFNDFEPALESRHTTQHGEASVRPVAKCPLFTVEQIGLAAGKSHPLALRTMHIVGVVSGDIIVESSGESLSLRAGEFCLVPAGVAARVKAGADASFLRAEAGR